MMHPSRWVASVIYVLAMFFTLYCAIKLQRIGLTLVCVIVQTAALVWYAASYVPFAQRCIRGVTSRIVA